MRSFARFDESQVPMSAHKPHDTRPCYLVCSICSDMPTHLLITHFHKYTYVIPYLSRKRKNIVAAPPLSSLADQNNEASINVNTKRQRLDIGFPSKLHPLKTHGSVRWDFAPWRSTFEHQEAKVVGYYKLRLWDAKGIISRAHWHKTRCRSRRTSRGVTSARKDHIWWAGRWVYKPGI